MEIEESNFNINSSNNITFRNLYRSHARKSKAPNECRLIKDLEEVEKDDSLKDCISFYSPKYTINKETSEINMVIDFFKMFSVKVTINSDYPYVPPTVVYFGGSKHPNVFDNEGKVLFKKTNPWTAVKGIKELIHSIMNLVYCEQYERTYNVCEDYLINEDGPFPANYPIINYYNLTYNSKNKYGKRKWKEYVKESKEDYKCMITFLNDIEKNIKCSSPDNI